VETKATVRLPRRSLSSQLLGKYWQVDHGITTKRQNHILTYTNKLYGLFYLLPMYSLNARHHFNWSPLLFSLPAPQNRCGQTEGGNFLSYPNTILCSLRSTNVIFKSWQLILGTEHRFIAVDYCCSVLAGISGTLLHCSYHPVVTREPHRPYSTVVINLSWLVNLTDPTVL